MSYTPHTWTSGEVVTASKMNALEQGVGNAGGSGLLIDLSEMTDRPYTTNVTGAQVIEAAERGLIPVVKSVDEFDGTTYTFGPLYVYGDGSGGITSDIGPMNFASPSSYVIVEYWD